MQVAMRIIGADLWHSVVAWGKMSVYADVDVVSVDGRREHVATTPVDWIGDRTPVWNFTSAACSVPPDGSCYFEMEVWSKTMMDSRRIGWATVRLDQFVTAEVLTSPLSTDEEDGGTQEIGTISAQLFDLEGMRPLGQATMPPVDPEKFISPVSPINVSGGTAAIFHLELAEAADGESKLYWIGKDLGHTPIERSFYEAALAYTESLRAGRLEDPSNLGPVLKFMFECLGVVTLFAAVKKENSSCLCSPAHDNELRDLLVLRSLFDSCKEFRMMDLKIGQKTASAGWYGKSWDAAMYRKVIDKHTTNSGCEGFRVAGFNGKPKAMTSRDPLHDIPSLDRVGDSKKAWGFVLGAMHGVEIFRHFMDMHQVEYSEQDVHDLLSPDEVAEIALNEIVSQLVQLAALCRKVNAPQKWVGSSVCLGFDCGHLPARYEPQEALRKTVRVHIFDWGRSELNTMASHIRRSPEEQEDRARYWQFYLGGLDRLVWECVRAYRHRFCNASKWDRIRCTVYDYDSDLLHDDDYLAEAVLTLEETRGERQVLLQSNPKLKRKEAGDCTLTYSMSFEELPGGARIRGIWKVGIHRASNLPISDILSQKSDPFVLISAICGSGLEDGAQIFETTQQGNVIVANLNPQWDETFCIPIAADDGLLVAALDRDVPGLGACLGDADKYFPPDNSSDEAMAFGLRNWIRHVNNVVGVPAGRAALAGSLVDAAASASLDAAAHAWKAPLHFARTVSGLVAARLTGRDKG